MILHDFYCDWSIRLLLKSYILSFFVCDGLYQILHKNDSFSSSQKLNI